MPDICALDKFPCAACGAQAQWNPAKQLLVCPFCGSAAPFTVDAATGAIEELDLAKALREIPDRGSRLAGRKADRPVPELQGRLGLRPGARRAELRLLRLAGARRLPGDQGADPAAEPAAVHRHGRQRPRADSEVVREQVAGAGKLKSRALVDRVHGVYIPYWTFDAQVVCPWDAEAGHYYYTTETYREGGRTRTRQVRHVRWVPASGRDRALLRRRAGPRDARRVARAAGTGRAVPDQGSQAVRHGVSLRLRRRALPDRPLRRRQAVPGCDGRQADRDVRCPGSGRYLSQPADSPGLFRARRSSTSSCPSGS